MQEHRFLLLFLAAIFLFSSCVSEADFDIRGEWEYTMTDSTGNVYDLGTITFRGEPAQGTYRQINIYDVEYEGRFTLNGSTLELTGYEMWKGIMTDTDAMHGTWTHEDGSTGIFAARRK